LRENLGRLDFQIAFCFTLFLGLIACLYTFSFYREGPTSGWRQTLQRWTAAFDFSLDTMGGFSYTGLILASILGLFLELLMIRWMSSEVRIFAFLKNYMLVSCFLGFGLGCFLCRKRINLIAMAAPLLSLVILIQCPWQPLRALISALPSYLGVASEVNSMGIPAVPFSGLALLALGAAIAITVPLFILNAMVFIPLGQVVGGYLESAPRGILAYSVNILGGLGGILLFTLLCQYWQPPVVWFAIAGVLLVFLIGKVASLRWAAIVTFGLCLALFWHPRGVGQEYWSPYQYLEISERLENGEVIAYQLDTNHTWFQQVVNLSPEFVGAHPQFFSQLPSKWDAYNLPYLFYPNPPNVLVLGAGMGNDVAAALRNGAGHVVAVEIDPLIIRLGREFHFERPYSSPRVTPVANDARSYVENSKERFDLIVYSLLDSHTNVSNYSSVRIDNYVYTLEAMEAARRLLKGDGILVLKFQVHTPWIAGRLHGLLQTVFAQTPIDFYAEASKYSSGGSFFVVGSSKHLERALSSSELAVYVKSHSGLEMESAHLTTDNWPFFYQHEPGLPLIIIIMSVLLVALTRLLIRNTEAAATETINWHLFFLGAGFLLLEAQIVSRMAMLFGTTWLVNSIVIAAILVLIVAVNFLVDSWPTIPVQFAYFGIGICLLVSYFLPLEKLFFQAFWVKALVATLVLCSPVPFASIVFIRSFAQYRFSGHALGSNLLGALVGGMLESASLWTGIRSLVILAMALYFLSFLFLLPEKSAAAKVPIEVERRPA